MRWIVAVAIGATALAGTAVAQDRNGYHAITAGEWQVAEQRLQHERRIYPDRPELMLNLAAIYGRTGRIAEARALYASVLDRRSVMMDMPDGVVRSSHDLAGRALNRLSPIAAAR